MTKHLRTACHIVASFVLTGCSPAFWQGAAQGLAATTPSGTKLMVFGGQGHQVFLGCMSCSQYDAESIFNQYGSHGSRYSAQSVLNPYSEFGSLYSATSACNPYASDPPVIVDGNGTYYGRLTVNPYRSDGPPTQQLRAWLAAVCKH